MSLSTSAPFVTGPFGGSPWRSGPFGDLYGFPFALDLNFVQMASLQSLDPRITFSRSGVGRRVNPQGFYETIGSGLPRFTFDPVTRACRGLLLESTRANFFLQSSVFSNAVWVKTRATITANALVSPDGTANASKLVEDTTASNTHFIEQVVSVTSGQSYTLSVFAKAGERTTLILQFFVGATFSASFNLSNGTSTGGKITPQGNGWYRCELTAVASATGSGFFDFFLSNGGSTYTGDGTSGLYIWEAQMELGVCSTSPISTTGAGATRNADSAAMTGANFSSWYNAVEGGFVATFTPLGANSDIAGVFSANDGTVANRVDYRALQGIAVVAGSSTAQTLGSASAQDVQSKVAVAYSSAGILFARNGGNATSQTAVPNPAATRLDLGGIDTPDIFALNGALARLQFANKRPTAAQCLALTL